MRQWTTEEDALLGTDYDHKIAEAIGCKRAQVAARRYKLGVSAKHSRGRPKISLEHQDWHDLLGTLSDVQVSQQANVPGPHVYRVRTRLGIPALSKSGLRPLDWHDLLGTMPDTHVALRAGLTRARVGQVRNQLGIPVFKKVCDA